MNPLKRMGIMQEINISAQPGGAGQEIAREFLTRSTGSDRIEKDSRDVLNDGFEAITGSDGCSEGEKTLATLGKAYKSNIPGRYPSSMAMLSLMHHMATAIPAPGPTSAIIAQECLATAREMADSYDGENTALSIFDTGFKVISGSPSVSDEEKKLALLGEKIADMPLYGKDALIGSHVIMSSLAKAPSGPASAIIPYICVNAGLHVSLPTSSRYIMEQGFSALQNEPGLTEKERALVDLGSRIAAPSEDNFVASFAKLSLMDAIASSIPGTIGQIVSHIAIDTVDIIEDEAGSIEVLDQSFKTIAESSLSGEKERALAREGLEAGGDAEKKNIILGRKFLVMNRIAKLSENSGEESDPTLQSSGITVDDDAEAVSIGGLRLDRNRD